MAYINIISFTGHWPLATGHCREAACIKEFHSNSQESKDIQIPLSLKTPAMIPSPLRERVSG